MNNNLIDVLVSTSSGDDFDLLSRFVYNSYITNERSINDNQISLTSSRKLYRYVELSLAKNVNSLSTDRSNFIDIDENIKEYLLSLSKKNKLLEEDEYFFNKINKYDNSKYFFYNKTKDNNNQDKIKSYYNISNSDDYMSIIDSLSNNSKSFIRKDASKFAIDSELNHLFPSEEEISVYENYDKIYNQIYSKESYLNDPVSSIKDRNVFNNFNKLSTIDSNLKPDINVSKCGFYIEKYKKVGDLYEKIASRFVFEETRSNRNSYGFNQKDEAVKYGETYVYTFSEVFLYRVKSKDQFNLDFYLLCDYPFITKDIQCIENRNPLPPNGPNIYFNKNKNELKIKWNPQSNDQNDVLGFQILRRKSLTEPYTVIAQLEGHQLEETFERKENIDNSVISKNPGIVKTSYVDKEYNKDEVTIYCIRSIDAHGNLSLYSNQVAVYYDFFEDNLIVDLVSKEGAPLEKPNLYIPRKTILFDNEDFTITNTPIINNKQTFKLYITPDFVNLQDHEVTESNKLVLGSKYKFSLFKLNNYSSYEENFEIKNFNLDT